VSTLWHFSAMLNSNLVFLSYGNALFTMCFVRYCRLSVSVCRSLPYLVYSYLGIGVPLVLVLSYRYTWSFMLHLLVRISHMWPAPLHRI
jgi:hypothetical protein